MSAEKNINRNNYEEFFIDYLDGKLTDNSIKRLESFLTANPDLREELEGIEHSKLQSAELPFEPKEQLLHIDLSLPVCEENFSFFAIAAAEEDLTEPQLKAFSKYLEAHPEKAGEYEIFLQLRLHPVTSIQYPDKETLKKPLLTVYRKELYAGLALAAGLALFIGLFFTLNEKTAVNIALETTPLNELSKEVRKDSVQETIPLIKAVNTSKPDSLKKLSPRTKSVQGIPLQSGFPLAENNIAEEMEEETFKLVANIDPAALRMPFPTTRPYDNLNLMSLPGASYSINKTLSIPTEYLTLQEFAKQKLSSLILGEANEDELSVWTLANAGLNKLNEKTGSEMKLERSQTSEGRTSFLSFSSRLLSFSTPLNRED